MSMVLLMGTLNRVMIVELSVPASLVGLMVAMPVLFAPMRAVIGFRSDTHRCALGWRRVPFLWHGTLLQFGGFAIMPFALLVLAGAGHASEAPPWIGRIAAALAFLLVGAGAHMVQTVGLALATDLTPRESHPRVVGLMYVMLLSGMMLSALIYGEMLADFSPGRLVQVIQAAAVSVLLLNVLAMWKQETRHTRPTDRTDLEESFRHCWKRLRTADHALNQLWVIGLGTAAFGMADILLEPFGGQIMRLDVAMTTRLTALLALGGLIGFGYASHVLARGTSAFSMAMAGVLIGIPAFSAVIAAAWLTLPALFLLANFVIGFAGAIFGHGTLTATMNRAPRDQAGLALGAWGAVQATAAGLGLATSGVARDLLTGSATGLGLAPGADGYIAVYLIEILLLCLTALVLLPLRRSTPRATSDSRLASRGAWESAA